MHQLSQQKTKHLKLRQLKKLNLKQRQNVVDVPLRLKLTKMHQLLAILKQRL